MDPAAALADDCSPGGKPALELLGDAHFLPLTAGRLTLFGAPAEKLPAWFRTHDGASKSSTRRPISSRSGSDLGWTELPVRDLTLRVSGRERAILELLHSRAGEGSLRRSEAPDGRPDDIAPFRASTAARKLQFGESRNACCSRLPSPPAMPGSESSTTRASISGRASASSSKTLRSAASTRNTSSCCPYRARSPRRHGDAAVRDSRFFAQADLMVRALPAVAAEVCFALKGGTAINLFVRDLPRLSVDIDLTYVPVEPRAESLRKISEALRRNIAGTEKGQRAGSGDRGRGR